MPALSSASLSSHSLFPANHGTQLLDSAVPETATLNYFEQSKTKHNKVTRIKQARDGPRTKSPWPGAFTKETSGKAVVEAGDILGSVQVPFPTNLLLFPFLKQTRQHAHTLNPRTGNRLLYVVHGLSIL